jgi:hypothetical protein
MHQRCDQRPTKQALIEEQALMDRLVQVIAHVLSTKRPERFCRTSCTEPAVPSYGSIHI